MNVEVVEHQCVYDGFFALNRFVLRHQCFDGSMSEPLVRERLDRARAAAVLLHDSERDSVILVEQFRIGALGHPHGAWLQECPAGMIEPGERPEEVASRECFEEVGCSPESLELIGEYFVSPGGSSERITLYYARINSQGLQGALTGKDDEGEDIRVHVVRWELLEHALEQGTISNATTLIALQWLQLKKLKETLSSFTS